jgi:hypothetical protein
MPKGVYERQPVEAIDVIEAPAIAPVKMVAMKLLRHYRPAKANFEIVGYTKAAVSKKMPNGEMKVVEPEEYITGEQCPPPFAGVVSTGKIWASTTIKVPEDEGKTMKRLGIAERDFED